MDMSEENDPVKFQKARQIFKQFDVNEDGYLSREEMGALVKAVNPRVKFTEQHINGILDEVFRTYSEFISGNEGLSFGGLLRTYIDGAGDIDRDFEALNLQLNDDGNGSKFGSVTSSITDERVGAAPLSGRRREHMPSWASSNIVCDNTWLLLEDLHILIKRLETKMALKVKERKAVSTGQALNDAASDVPWSSDLVAYSGSMSNCNTGNVRSLALPWEELGVDYTNFVKDLGTITQKADNSASAEEVFDAHMAIGWMLSDHALYKDALTCFKKASELKLTDPRPHFHTGNALYSLGNYAESRQCYVSALNAVEVSGSQLNHLLPQIHVNLGIALEGEGMLLSASEHYKVASSLKPEHYRALKLLGSALYGVGEYRAAEKVLRDAISLKPDFADAHCDLGSTLHAIGEDDEQAINEFQKALDIKPDHMEALYNLGGLFKDIGRYKRAAEMYSKVLALNPNHWRAQLNKAVSLLGAGEIEDARKALKDAFKMTNRVELYDAIMHLKIARKKPKGLTSSGSLNGSEDMNQFARDMVDKLQDGFLVVETSRFRRANEKTTPRQWLTRALEIRRFQRQTRLNRCEISNLRKEFDGSLRPTSTVANKTVKLVRKAELEKILHRLLHFLKFDTFQGAVKTINLKIISLLDSSASGQVDLGMFLALIAPICAGPVEKRKRVAFDALMWRSSHGQEGSTLAKSDALLYMKLLRAAYLSTQGTSDTVEVHQEAEEQTTISFKEFQDLFDDPDWGFGILSVLVKLEVSDRVRHGNLSCTICAYPITGPWFKEVRANFSLCSLCYSEGKVPISAKKEEYYFKEYNSEIESMKDKLRIFSSRSFHAH